MRARSAAPPPPRSRRDRVRRGRPCASRTPTCASRATCRTSRARGMSAKTPSSACSPSARRQEVAADRAAPAAAASASSAASGGTTTSTPRSRNDWTREEAVDHRRRPPPPRSNRWAEIAGAAPGRPDRARSRTTGTRRPLGARHSRTASGTCARLRPVSDAAAGVVLRVLEPKPHAEDDAYCRRSGSRTTTGRRRSRRRGRLGGSPRPTRHALDAPERRRTAILTRPARSSARTGDLPSCHTPCLRTASSERL